MKYSVQENFHDFRAREKQRIFSFFSFRKFNPSCLVPQNCKGSSGIMSEKYWVLKVAGCYLSMFFVKTEEKPRQSSEFPSQKDWFFFHFFRLAAMGSGVENSARIFAVEEGLVRNRIFDPFSFPGRKFGAVALRSPQRPPGVHASAPRVKFWSTSRDLTYLHY